MKSFLSRSVPALALLLLSGVGLGATPAFAAQARATLSTQEAYVGSPVTLYLEIADADSDVTPEIPQVDGLDIKSMGSPQRSSQTTIINGRRSHRVSETHVWQILPRREGTFEIPSMKIDLGGQTVSTQPQRFVVTRSETGDLLFAEITGHDEKIFVGQPMNLTLKIWVKPYHDRPLDLRLSEGDMWQMISQQRSNWGIFSDRLKELAENNQRPGGQEVLRADEDGNERAYYLYEIPATIYPKRPGAIDGNDVQVVVDYPTRLGKTRDPFDSFFNDDDFFGRSRGSMFGGNMPSMFGPKLAVTDVRPIVASASVNATQVTEIPTQNRPADYRGAVGHYVIATQATPTDVKAGDPITLHIAIKGDGPMDLVQAPPLSELSADFRVSDDPLAGIVQDETKYFTVSIRPRRAGVPEIPAIPLTYFDPQREEFVTVHSEPISIQVAPGDNLAADAIIGRQGSGAQPAAEPGQPVSYISFSNFSGADALQVSHPPGDLPYLLAFTIPPLFFFAVVLYRNRSRWSTWLSAFPGSNLREVNGALERATSPGQIVDALGKFLRSCHGGQLASMNMRETIANLRLRGFAGLDRCEQIIDRCEHSSYAGSSDADISGLIQEAKSCVATLAGNAPQRRTTGFEQKTMNTKLQGTQI